MESFWHWLSGVYPVRRALPVGIIWGLCASVLLLVPVYELGTAFAPSYAALTNQAFFISISFTSAWLLSAPEKTARAFLTSMAIVLSVSILAIVLYPPAANLPNFVFSSLYLRVLEVFVWGVIGGILGSFLTMGLDELLKPKSVYYNLILLAGVAIATSSFLLSLVEL